MHGERVQFQGPRGQQGYGLDAALIDVAAGDEWVYCERVGSALQIWTGPACRQCKGGQWKLTRCKLHANVLWVALQLRMA